MGGWGRAANARLQFWWSGGAFSNLGLSEFRI